jgi:hypothetical protein
MAGSAVHTPGDVQGSIASQWALTAFALLFLGLRILLKLARTPNRSFFVDDILLILSFVRFNQAFSCSAYPRNYDPF